MAALRVKFPHISRFFSATLLWLALIAVVSANGIAAINQSSERSVKLSAVLLSPTSSSAHLALATFLRQEGYLPAARQELAVFAEQNSNVLGAHTSLELLRTWEDEPGQLARAFSFWQHLAEQKPDYRDAFLQLSLAAYQLGNIPEARTAASRALALDPASPLAIQMLGITGKNQ